MPRNTRSSTGFTIFELAAVLATASVVGGAVLPPMFSRGRGGANEMQASSTLKDFIKGWQRYGMSNDGFFPGINGSGLDLLTRSLNDPVGESVDWINADARNPMQTVDWFSPIAPGLPADRASRYLAFFNDFADPAMKRTQVLWGGSDSIAEDGVQKALANQRITAGSWLAPSAFTVYGDRFPRSSGVDIPGVEERIEDGRLIIEKVGVGSNVYSVNPSPVSIEADYVPRFADVANASNKVAITTGTRFVEAQGLVDFDASIAPRNFGAFTCASPVFVGSTSFGTQSFSGGAGIPYSYRHAGRLITARFDGSVAPVTRGASFDPTLWYPTGSTFQGISAAPESFKFYKVGDTIN